MTVTQYEDLQRKFIIHILERTLNAQSDEVYQHRLGALLDSLSSYFTDEEKRALATTPFTMFDDVSFLHDGDDDDDPDVYCALSPQAKIISHAWLRRRGLDSDL